MSKKQQLTLIPFDPSQGRKSKKVPLAQVARMVNQRVGKINPNPKNTSETLKFDWVPVDKIYINYSRQRFPEPAHIKKLIGKWKLEVVTPLQARYDPDEDRYYIADGQQHGIAYNILYGNETHMPVFYVESRDENIESIQLLALNTDSQPMAMYFIHEQKCMMGDNWHVRLEDTVQKAGCATGYKKRFPGVITHMTDLINAAEDYGFDLLETVLSKYRIYWPTEPVKTATVMGFLKVAELLKNENMFDDDTLDDVFNESASFFESADRLHLDIKEEFEFTYPTNYRGMGVREKIASGIINAYEKRTGKTLVNKPFDIDMPEPGLSQINKEIA
jgi:hypothetical protein